MPLLGPVNPIALVSGAWRGLRRAQERLRADHRTLTMRHVRFSPQAMSRYYLHIAVAPSRRSVREWDAEQVDRAQRFARAFMAESWTEAPLTADGNVTTFGVTGDDQAFERVLYVWRDGLVELLWALDCDECNGERELDVLELGKVSSALARAVADPSYPELCRPRRRWPAARRTDWQLGVSTAISTANGQREWTRLRFPTEAPRRAPGSRANMPPEGYGRQALRSLRRRRAPHEVPLVLIRELRAANGYYGDANLDERVATQSLSYASS